MTPLRWLLLSAGLLCGTTVLVWSLVTHDWYAAGPAVLPAKAGQLDTKLAQIKSLMIASKDGLKEPLSCRVSEWVSVQVTAQGEEGLFRVSKPTLVNPKKSNSTSSGLRASILFQLVRRSSLGDGMKVVSGAGSGATIDKENLITWNGKMKMPPVPGDYLLRISLATVEGGGPGKKNIQTDLIGEFPIEVSE